MGACQSFFSAKFTSFDPNPTPVQQPSTSQEQLIPENGRMETPPKLEQLQKDIRSGLRELMKKSTDRENSMFILPQDLEDFWSPYMTQFYRRQRWYDTHWDKTNHMRSYHKIISILILARFEDWVNFKKIFVDKERNDEKLPFTKKRVEQKDFLGSDLGPDFWKNQWILCPLVIAERQNPYELIGEEAERRFPYIGTAKVIGEGATGTVSKQVIAARHLIYSPPLREAQNTKPKHVACKRVVERTVDSVEFENLRSLRKCLTSHKNIMVNLATIIQVEPNGDRVHWILYDLAAYDLYTLLTQRTSYPDSAANHTNDRLMRHDSAPSKRNNSHIWWAGDLIKESTNLADALDYLHNQLYQDGGYYLVHNDLKPENILVFYPDSEDENDRFPVGQWKIADFGLAKIKERPAEKQARKRVRNTSQHLTTLGPDTVPAMVQCDPTHRRNLSASVRSPSITTAKRDPGLYTSPEILAKGEDQVEPRAGDLWAFGCILTDVVAYAVAPHLLKELRIECEKPRGLDQKFHDVDTNMLKESFTSWLNDLPNRCDGEPESRKWVVDCVDLIFRILVQDPRQRCKANTIRDELRKIAKDMKRDKSFILADRPQSDPDSISVSSSTAAVDFQFQNGSGSKLGLLKSLDSPRNFSPQAPYPPIMQVTSPEENETRNLEFK